MDGLALHPFFPNSLSFHPFVDLRQWRKPADADDSLTHPPFGLASSFWLGIIRFLRAFVYLNGCEWENKKILAYFQKCINQINIIIPIILPIFSHINSICDFFKTIYIFEIRYTLLISTEYLYRLQCRTFCFLSSSSKFNQWPKPRPAEGNLGNYRLRLPAAGRSFPLTGRLVAI
jgi:hypothetical protein